MNTTNISDLRHSNLSDIQIHHPIGESSKSTITQVLKMDVSNFENVTVRELPKKFDGKGETKGFMFVQLRANESAYLYEVTNLNRTYYEVFKRIVYERYGIVSYPKANAFGLTAWTIESLTKANAKFDQLTKQANEPTSVIPTSE